LESSAPPSRPSCWEGGNNSSILIRGEAYDFEAQFFYIAEAIPFEERKVFEDLVCYFVRAPFSLQKLVYFDCQQAVL
jgi:hypothetical protein